MNSCSLDPHLSVDRRDDMARPLLGLVLAALVGSAPDLGAAAREFNDGREALARAMASVSNATARAQGDAARPVYHFRPPAYWMNDPNGPIQYRGWYHIFYQHNPYGDQWGHMHWGHARSRDLVHWEHLPIALWPSKEAGEEHVFSGCSTLNGRGEPLIFYTSIGRGQGADVHAEQWAALGSDDLATWRKHPENPILAEVLHGDRKVYDWRDPFVCKAGPRTFMVCGGNLNQGKGGEAVVNLYEAQNPELTRWSYRAVLFTHPDPAVKNIECPLFFPLDGRWVLIISPHRRVEWFTGDFDPESGKFTAKRRGLMDYSDHYYAPNCFKDDAGRNLLFGWVRGFPKGRGWNGCLTLPRRLSVDAGGVVNQQPAPETDLLRGERMRIRNRPLSSEPLVAEARGNTLEIEAILERGDATKVGLEVLRSEDGKRSARITWDGKQLEVAGTPMSLFGDLTGERVELRAFLDRSVIEVYAAGQSLTRVVPFESGDDRVAAFAEGQGARLTALTVWKLQPVW